MKKMTILLFIITAVSVSLRSQITVTFLPVNEYFFTSDQIWNFNIINTGKSTINANLEVSVLKNGSYPLMTTKINGIELIHGMNTITNATRAAALTIYGSDAVSQNFQNTSILSPGNYALCITVKNTINQIIGYSCRELNINGFTLPVLTSPLNEQTVYTNSPLFTWLPVLPATIQGVTYKLEIWETGVGANYKLTGNLYETILTGTNFQYFAGLPLFVTGTTYSWKVSAYADDFYLGCSQVWEFTIGSGANARLEGEEEEDSYRVIGDQTQHAEYLADSALRISYTNLANDSLLSYVIYPVNQPDSACIGLPEIILRSGINIITIDLQSLEEFIDDQKYTLEITDGNERRYSLNFLFTEL